MRSFVQGFIRLCCCQKCSVEYHITCWKSVKTSVFSEKNEKVGLLLHLQLFVCLCCRLLKNRLFELQDILHDACLTPDCVGQICCIKIFGPTGLVKCKVRRNLLISSDREIEFAGRKVLFNILFSLKLQSSSRRRRRSLK